MRYKHFQSHNYKIRISAFLVLLSIVMQAQPPKKFYNKWGGNGYDVANDVKQTLDNGYIITGSTSSFGQGNTDLYITKIDSMGRVKFETSFGGPNNEIGNSVVQLSDSSYAMVGYTSSSGVGGYDMYFIKLDKAGNFLWQKTFGGNDWDFANSLTATLDGGFIIAGTTYSYGRGNADGYVIKIDGNGIENWSKTFGGKRDDEFKSVIATTDGNFALTGYTKSYNDSLGDAWVFKIDANGDSLWCKFYGGNKEDYGNQILESINGDFYIAGATASFGVGLLDCYAIKTNSLGVLTATFIDGTASKNEVYTSVAFSKLTTQNLVCFIEKETFPGYGLQTKIIEFDYNLIYHAATEYGSVYDDELFKLISTNDKGYACVGYTKGYGAINTDVYFIKSDSTLIGSTSIVSVNELSNESFNTSVFPNPTTKEITIITNLPLTCSELRLYTINGNEIEIKEKTHQLSKNKIILNLESLNDGLYYLNYQNQTKKISLIH